MIQIGRHQLDADCVADRLYGGGRLYQGSAIDAGTWTVLDTTFSMVVLCAEELQDAPLQLRLQIVRAGFRDTPWPSRDDLAAAARAARTVVGELTRGGRVLVTCAAGLNRSGLVTGLALGHAIGSGEDAVRLIRRARGNAALGNPTFYRIVRERPLTVLDERRARTRSNSDSEVPR